MSLREAGADVFGSPPRSVADANGTRVGDYCFYGKDDIRSELKYSPGAGGLQGASCLREIAHR